jgi:hypothetical protein
LVEQPIRNRQVPGSSPGLGSTENRRLNGTAFSSNGFNHHPRSTSPTCSRILRGDERVALVTEPGALLGLGAHLQQLARVPSMLRDATV